MWVFLSQSFLSIVKHRTKANTLLVRARVKGDIERVFPDAEVITTPTADYMYRAIVPAKQVAAAMQQAVLDIDYPNFKASVPYSDTMRLQAYSWVWEDMVTLQADSANAATNP